VPALLAGLSWFVERWKNSFQKNTEVFLERWGAAVSGSNNIFPNDPTTKRNGANQSISYLYLIRSNSLLLIPPALSIPDNKKQKR